MEKIDLSQKSKFLSFTVYGLGEGLSYIIGFFLLPIFTRIFSTTEYGIIEMMATILAFLGLFLSMGLDSAQSYYFFNQKKKGEKVQTILISSILQFRLLSGFILILIILVLSPQINLIFFDGKLSLKYFLISLTGVLFLQFKSQSAEIFRLLFQPFNYVSITLSNTLITFFFGIILIVYLKWGVFGYYTGYAIGAILSAIGGCWSIRKYLDWSKLHSDLWPKLLRFGIPLLPFGILALIMNISDRWFIKYMLGLNYLGIYAVGAKCSLILFFISTVFRTSWWPIAMESLNNKNNKQLFIFVSKIFLGLSMSIVVLVSLFAPLLIKIIAPVEYFEGYKIIGFLSISAVFFGFVQISQLGIYKSERTGVMTLIALACVIVNIVLNFILIPIWGIMGASGATMFAMFLRNLISILISEKRMKIGYPLHIFSIQIILGLFSVTLLLCLNYNLISIIISIFIMFILILSSAPLNQMKNLLIASTYYLKNT